MKLPQAELELSQSAALNNFKYFKSLLKEQTKTLVLVKSNSYGHGIVEFSKLMLEAGVDYLGIATLEEGIILRQAGIGAPILALSTGYDCYSDLVKYNPLCGILGEALVGAPHPRHQGLSHPHKAGHRNAPPGL